MRANELRIGNQIEYYVFDEFGKPQQEWVGGYVDIEDLKWLDQHPGDKHYRPIKLTEDILIRFGFYETTKEHYVSGLYTLNKPDGFYINKETMCYCDIDYEGTTNDRIKIQYVHQLQNLYFALTGKEL
jgi:hypothetical protein